MATRADHARRPGRSSKEVCTRVVRLAIYLRDGFSCSYCGVDLSMVAPADMGLDHLRPRCKRGHHHHSNLVLACRQCNRARGTQPWWRYATAGAVVRIRRQRRRALPMVLARALVRNGAAWADTLWQAAAVTKKGIAENR